MSLWKGGVNLDIAVPLISGLQLTMSCCNDLSGYYDFVFEQI